jgi:hypothetical protein
MTIETRREKLLFYGVVPILAAVAGALAVTYATGSACPAPPADLTSIIRDTSLSGPEKLKALEIYEKISDRPWDIARSFMSLFFIALGLFGVAIGQRIASRPR